MSNKIAVVGDRDSVMCFMSVGFSVFELSPDEIDNDPTVGAGLLRRLANENHAVIFVTEEVAVKLEDTIAKYRGKPTPAIIVIPGKAPTGYGMAALNKAVEKAVGANIGI